MPNWITNKLTISSDKPEVLSFVKERVATTTKEHGFNPFSLNAIVPQPESLNILKGSISIQADKLLNMIENGDRGEAISYFVKNIADGRVEKILFGENAANFGAKADLITADDLDYVLKYAITRRDNVKKYGTDDWYNWRVFNWGCKWDAKDVELSENKTSLVYIFFTPWNSPAEALVRLYLIIKERYPEDHTLEMVLQFQDEMEWASHIATIDESGVEVIEDEAPSM